MKLAKKKIREIIARNQKVIDDHNYASDEYYCGFAEGQKQLANQNIIDLEKLLTSLHKE